MEYILNETLPKKIYIGKNPYCQPAYLDNFEYIVSNEIPKPAKNPFLSLKDFKQWTEIVNTYINILQEEYVILNKLYDISKYINKEFNFLYLPQISLIFKDYESKSTVLTLKNLLIEIKERNKVKIQFILFLKSNELCENLDLTQIQNNIKLYYENYPKYKEILNKNYQIKLDVLESYSILNFSKRCNVPFIAARQFIEEDVKVKNNIEIMIKKRLMVFSK